MSGTTTATPSPTLGSLIRMRALKPAALPANPSLSSQQTSSTPPDLQEFVTAALNEAQNFMTAYLLKKFTVKSTAKQSPPSTASVEVLSHEIHPADLPKDIQSGSPVENWFARTSVHESAAKNGTASWEEFDSGLRVNHSQHEKDYTPSVFDAHEVLNWDESLQGVGRQVGEWSDVHMAILEMVHQIPSPMNDRVFSILVLTAKRSQEFLVVQIPVDTATITGAKYNKAPKITTGMYCSIEHGELIDEGSKVRWRMATASDAKGMLPMMIQKMALPGAVVKDVGWFIGWCEKRRKSVA